MPPPSPPPTPPPLLECGTGGFAIRSLTYPSSYLQPLGLTFEYAACPFGICATPPVPHGASLVYRDGAPRFDELAFDAIVNTSAPKPLLILSHRASSGKRVAAPKNLPDPAAVAENTHLELYDFYGMELDKVESPYSPAA